MGERGPAPKPTALRLLHGDRKDRINLHEPIPGSTDVLPPRALSDEEQAIWDRLAPDLISKGVLTHWDVDLFLSLIRYILLHERALDEVERGEVSSLRVAKEAFSHLVTLAGRFGLTPSDRSKLSIDKGKDDPREDYFS